MSKIRIKIGAVELEYEGSDEFLKDELPLLLDKLQALAPAGLAASFPPTHMNNGGEAHSSPAMPPSREIGTTSSIAADLGAKTGPDLALAGAVRLVIGLGRSAFTRKELLTEMQSATAYYNKNMSSNLSKMLIAMVKDKVLREVAKDTYSLSAETKRDMESRFGS